MAIGPGAPPLGRLRGFRIGRPLLSATAQAGDGLPMLRSNPRGGFQFRRNAMLANCKLTKALAGAFFFIVAYLPATFAWADSPDNSSTEKSRWEINDLFSPCKGDCGVALLFGKSVSRTPMTSIFLHFQSPAYWQWDDTYIATLSAKRTWIKFGKYFSIDPEIGIGRRFGVADGAEAWLALYVRWHYFPWSDYVRTSIGAGIGPSLAPNVTIGPNGLFNNGGVAIANYFSPELEIGLPSHPDFNLVVRYQHRSNIWGVLQNNSEDSQFWTVGMRINF
jgi:hypothetical protein